jgi:DNA topoisomerase-3
VYKLVITEKPSVSKSISAVLGANERKYGFFITPRGVERDGNGYIVAWCYGHLLELAAPDVYGEQYAKWRYRDLPIVPQEWKHTPNKDKAAQLKILKELLNRPEIEYVVNACDAGREGELIFRLVYEYAKSKLPLKRLWVSSMEDSAIRNGFNNLKAGAEYDSLYTAAYCREQADWLLGLNSTRLFSILYGSNLSVGRVQSPTLAMLVKRETEIDNFVKTPFYTVELDGGFTAVSERFSARAEAENTAANCATATVTAVTRTEKSIAPPKLYDLTTLQREANRIHGFTAAQTLEYLQSLYEQKLSTYPRVDSRYLTDDMAGTVTELVHLLSPDAPCDVSQVIDNEKVSDHSAIIPTSEIVSVILDTLPSGARVILDMITNRLICAVGERHRYIETAVTLNCNDADFKAKGKSVIYNGWKVYAADATDEPDEDDETDASIPALSEGQTISVTAKVKEGFTSPPKHFTEDTILAAMDSAGAEDMPEGAERRGIGTPSTRSIILEKTIKSGYVERSKKNLLPTEKGKNLIAVLPNELKSPALTADWEHKLFEVKRGELTGAEFINSIAAFAKTIVLENDKPKPEFTGLFSDSKKHVNAPLGICPRCGSSVRESEKGFFCDSHSCEFKLWKNSRFWTSKKKPLTAEIVAALLGDGRVLLTDLYSEKTGKLYDAAVILEDTGEKFVNFKLIFDKKGGLKQ